MVHIDSFLDQVGHYLELAVSRSVKQTSLAYKIDKADWAPFSNEPIYHIYCHIIIFNHHCGEESILLELVVE
jgi:hypothetical protein